MAEGKEQLHPLQRFAARNWKALTFFGTLVAVSAKGISSIGDKTFGVWCAAAVIVWILIRFRRVQTLVLRIIYGPPPPLSNPPRYFRGPRPFGV
ncbi:MAG: hypothetical protein AAF585_24860, partial [Verrucomicrobiota bacterium]